MTKTEQRIEERAKELYRQNGEWCWRKALAVAIREEEQREKQKQKRRGGKVSVRPIGLLEED